MTVYNQQDFVEYIKQNIHPTKNKKVYVITNSNGEALDIGKRGGQFRSKSAVKQALNCFVVDKLQWYEYKKNIPHDRRLGTNQFNDEVSETVKFLLDNRIVVIEERG